MVLPYIDMNPPWVYMCSPSWSPFPLPPHPIPLGHPSAPASSTLYQASNLEWWFISHVIIYMFQCHSPISSCQNPGQHWWQKLKTKRKKEAISVTEQRLHCGRAKPVKPLSGFHTAISNQRRKTPSPSPLNHMSLRTTTWVLVSYFPAFSLLTSGRGFCPSGIHI